MLLFALVEEFFLWGVNIFIKFPDNAGIKTFSYFFYFFIVASLTFRLAPSQFPSSPFVIVAVHPAWCGGECRPVAGKVASI